jgi:hypothetical protein
MSNPRLLIAITSCHKHREWQFAQRQTWVRDIPHGVSYRFFLGNPIVQDALEDEVFLDAPDDYSLIPVKMKGIFQWALDQGFNFAFKVDIDTLVNVQNLLDSGFDKHDYVGGLYSQGVATPFASGGSGFMLSEKAMRLVVEEPVRDDGYDDVLVALAMKRGNIPLHADSRYRFSPGYTMDGKGISYHLSSISKWKESYFPTVMFEKYLEMKRL